MAIYGYCRISTEKQNIERQHRNIYGAYPDVKRLYSEAYTGTKQDRPEWLKLLKVVKAGDTIVFDSVSRMSRNSEEGVAQYFELYEAGVHLVFLKEPHINTSVYKQQITNASLGMTDNEVVNAVLEGVSKALHLLAKEQIKLAFDQSEKEVKDLSKRTSEGLKTAKLNGKQIGHKVGSTYETKKAKNAKEKILRYSKTFVGKERGMSDKELLDLMKIDRGTFYKYKKELKAELEQMNAEQ